MRPAAIGPDLRAGRLFMKVKGFTLIELLVTLVIIGIIISLSTLAIGNNAGDKLDEEKNRLTALFQMAREEAIMQGRELGMEFWENGYAFYELNDVQQWLPLEDDQLFRIRKLPEGMRLQLNLEEIEVVMSVVKKDKPQVFILSSGETSPFKLEMDFNDEYTTRIDVDALGNIKEVQDEDDDKTHKTGKR